MNLSFSIPLTNRIFHLQVDRSKFWLHIYYKYQINDAVFGFQGYIPNSDFQMLGLDFDDKFDFNGLIKEIIKIQKEAKRIWDVDLGKASVFETSKKKFYVWFFESRLPYSCDCPTILNIARTVGKNADVNFIQWLMTKNCCVMRLDPKKFKKEKPKLVAEIGKSIPISKDQKYNKKFLLNYLDMV